MCPPPERTVLQHQDDKMAASLGKKNCGKRSQLKPYEIELTPKQMLLTALPAFIAFGLGVFTRVYYLENPATQPHQIQNLVKPREMPKPVLASWKKNPAP